MCAPSRSETEMPLPGALSPFVGRAGAVGAAGRRVWRDCVASSAASETEMADGFLRGALRKENFGRGASAARVVVSFSVRALIA